MNKFTKTFISTKVFCVRVFLKDNTIQSEALEPFTIEYMGLNMKHNAKTIMRFVKKNYPSVKDPILVTGTKRIKEIYEIDREVFFKVAKKVEEI